MNNPTHKNRIVGLLGGSFNPAHEGHVHISLYALHKLKLDEVWWLVSPHNPLKDKQTLADYDVRFASAKALARHPRITVSDIEQRKDLRYTYRTLRYLKKHHPGVTFVWLMGADNLDGFHRWQRWQWIMAHMPIVVFDRAPFSHKALAAKAALRARRFILHSNKISGNWAPPLLHIARLKLAPQSSTAIRKTAGWQQKGPEGG